MTLKFKKLFSIILILFLTIGISACSEDLLSGKIDATKTGSINGIVKNNNGKILSGVAVSISNKSDTTNDNGVFNIEGLETGGYSLIIETEGYKKTEKSITVNEGSNNLGEIILEKNTEYYSLNINIEGKGTVNKDPDKEKYEKDSKVNLTASPQEGWEFSNWSGSVESSKKEIEVIMGSEKTIKATFKEVDSSLEINNISDKTIDEGKSLTFTVETNYQGDDEINLEAKNLPNGANFNNSTGEFSWTPTSEDIGDYKITFSATVNDEYTEEIVNVTVNEVDNSPELEKIGDKAINEGETLNLTLNANDPNNDELTYSASGLPTNASLNSSTGEFTWTPTYKDSGTYSVTFYVSDGTNKDSETINISVNDSLVKLNMNIKGKGEIIKDPNNADNIYDKGTEVTLSANSNLGWKFESWNGDIASNNKEEVILLDSNKDITAVFIEEQYVLNINNNGEGSVTITPEKDYYYGDIVTLEANANDWWKFENWSGDINKSENPVEITIKSDTNISANFSEIKPNPPTNINAKLEFGKVNISWDSPTDPRVNEYKIYRSESESGTKTLLKTVSANEYNDNTIKGGKTYYYWIKSVTDSNLTSDFSSLVSINIPSSSSTIIFSRYNVHSDGGTYEENGIYSMSSKGFNLKQLYNIDTGISRPDVSPSTDKIAFVQDRNNIYTIDMEGNNQEKIINHGEDIGRVSWSPDGNLLTFRSDEDGDGEIYTINIDNKNIEKLTDNNTLDYYPDWSLTNDKIVFVNEANEIQNIYKMNSDGTNKINLTDDKDFNGNLLQNPEWSPSGNKIAFVVDYGSKEDLYVMESDGTNLTNLTNFKENDLYGCQIGNKIAWSPDGKKIAFTSDKYDGGSGQFQVYTINIDGTSLKRVTDLKGSSEIGDWIE